MKKTTLLILPLALIFLAMTGVSAFAADLVVYSAGPKSLSKAVVANFEKKTGLKVQLYPASTESSGPDKHPAPQRLKG
jgi:iron(III) transport system substrate-binding protein